MRQMNCMHTFYVGVKESFDFESNLVVLEALDRRGRFLGIVSEDSRTEAMEALKDLVLEVLLDQAGDLINPMESLFRRRPSRLECLELYLHEVFPVLLRFYRCRAGLTQSALAAELAMTQQVYARLERPGKANPTLLTIQRLEKAMNRNLLALV